jgi:hypothetical protein
MSQPHNLDFSRLPDIQSIHVFLNIPEELICPIATLSRTIDRLQNAVRFTWYSMQQRDILRCEEAEVPRLREGFFRAALMELVSVEEILALDISHACQKTTTLKLNETSLPHLHLFRELRNHELHLHHNRLSSTPKGFVFGNSEKLEAERQVTIDIFSLEGVTKESFSKLDNSRRYRLTDLVRLINWFNNSQNRWGVQEIMLRVVFDYCSELRKKYFPPP